jgi:hypothetical protein
VSVLPLAVTMPRQYCEYSHVIPFISFEKVRNNDPRVIRKWRMAAM